MHPTLSPPCSMRKKSVWSHSSENKGAVQGRQRSVQRGFGSGVKNKHESIFPRSARAMPSLTVSSGPCAESD